MLTYLVPLFTGWSFFAYGFDLAEIFTYEKTWRCHLHCGIKIIYFIFQRFFSSLLWRGFFSKFVAVFSWLKFSSIINSLSKSFVWRGSRFYTLISRRFLKILTSSWLCMQCQWHRIVRLRVVIDTGESNSAVLSFLWHCRVRAGF